MIEPGRRRRRRRRGVVEYLATVLGVTVLLALISVAALVVVVAWRAIL